MMRGSVQRMHKLLTPALALRTSSFPPKREPFPPLRLVASGSDEDGEMVRPQQGETGAEIGDGAALETPRRPLRVVIVEDEAIIAMELEMLIEELGAQIVGTAASAAEAEALVRAQRPDCVTMDISINGDRDGVDAAIKIFEHYGVRSIFVSAYGNAATRAKAEPANPLGWVRKPIDKADLGDILRRVVPSDD